MSSQTLKTDVVIIGAGPAGITAAVQLKRMAVDFVLIEKDWPGGLIRNANLIENYPGFPNGITGLKFTRILTNHLDRHNIVPIKECVRTIDFIDNRFNTELSNSVIQSDYLIIASGTKPNPADDVEISDLCKPFVLPEIASIIDFNLDIQTGKLEFAIIGSGDAAFDYALNLSGRGIKSDIFMRRQHSKALKLLQDRVKNTMESGNGEINLFSEHELKSVHSDINTGTLVLSFEYKGATKEYNCNYLLFAIGRSPNLDFLTPSIIPRIYELESSKRLFFVGDVKNKNDRQLSIAIGDAMKAAMTIYHELYPDR